VPLLFAATVPSLIRMLPVLGGAIGDLLDPAARDRALDGVGASCARSAPHCAPGLRRPHPVRRLPHPAATGGPAPPLPDEVADLGRHVAARLAGLTAEAAQTTGCEVVPAAAASAGHHAWSAEPWTVGAGSLLPWRPKPFHPNAAGMRAVAGMIAALLQDP
jgi:hypothetical protein